METLTVKQLIMPIEDRLFIEDERGPQWQPERKGINISRNYAAPHIITWGNGQKREYLVLFWPKTDVPENNSDRECCWPYLIGQYPLSPVFGQKRPGTPGNSYFAQFPPVFGHFMFLSGWLLDCSNGSTWATRTINSKISTR